MFKTAVTTSVQSLHVQDCSDCTEVQEIKNKVPRASAGRFVQIPKALEHEVLLFADRKHQGFAEAYTRIKSWADFPEFKRKVLHSNKGF